MVAPISMNRRAHMANERTFLAWVRTAIGIMAFGLVIEEFAFGGSPQFIPTPGPSQFTGLVLIIFGVMITIFSYVGILLSKGSLIRVYKSNIVLTTALALFVNAVGLFLFIYLITRCMFVEGASVDELWCEVGYVRRLCAFACCYA